MTDFGNCPLIFTTIDKFQKRFWELKPDSCTRFPHKSHFPSSPPGKAPVALESKNYGVLFYRLVDNLEMRQLIDNPFTALQSALKMRLGHHTQK